MVLSSRLVFMCMSIIMGIEEGRYSILVFWCVGMLFYSYIWSYCKCIFYNDLVILIILLLLSLLFFFLIINLGYIFMLELCVKKFF